MAALHPSSKQSADEIARFNRKHLHAGPHFGFHAFLFVGAHHPCWNPEALKEDQ
jgi:hypothetical protein